MRCEYEPCGKIFFRNGNYSKRFCSQTCAARASEQRRYGDQYKSEQLKYGWSSSTTGAVSELVVCVDLMRRGYEVFRAVSPDASCDLIAVQGSVSLRVEVRTGRRFIDGRLDYPRMKRDIGRQDIYAVVIGGLDVEYDPDLPVL
jgi:hypothetical protein